MLFLEPVMPRYFVIYPDGNGEELLRYDDISEYISQADVDPSCAVIKTEVEGDAEATAVTIIKPFEGIS